MSAVIEFCGLPGAGKSSLARAVVRALRVGGIGVEDRSIPVGRPARAGRLATKAAGGMAAAVTSPGIVLAVARAAWSSGLRGREWLARTVNIVVLHRRSRHSSRGVVLLDQGVVQELVAVGHTADARALARRLPAACWGAGRILVHVGVSHETAAERLGGRGTGESRLEHLPRTARVEALAVADRLLDDLAVVAGEAGVRVWWVDGEAPDLVDALVTEIRRSALV